MDKIKEKLKALWEKFRGLNQMVQALIVIFTLFGLGVLFFGGSTAYAYGLSAVIIVLFGYLVFKMLKGEKKEE